MQERKSWCVAHSNQSRFFFFFFNSLIYTRKLTAGLWLAVIGSTSTLPVLLLYGTPCYCAHIYVYIYISPFISCRFCSPFPPMLCSCCWSNMLPGDMFLSKVLCKWKKKKMFFLISVNSSSLLMMCIVFLEGMLFIKCLPAEQVTKHSRVLVQYLPAVSSTPM